MVMPELARIVKRKVVIRLKNPINGSKWSIRDGQEFGVYAKTSHIFSIARKGQNIGLNTAPEIIQRTVLSSGWFDCSISSTGHKPCVDAFAREPLVKQNLRPYTRREKSREIHSVRSKAACPTLPFKSLND